jgi:hypothetical protein
VDQQLGHMARHADDLVIWRTIRQKPNGMSKSVRAFRADVEGGAPMILRAARKTREGSVAAVFKN